MILPVFACAYIGVYRTLQNAAARGAVAKPGNGTIDAAKPCVCIADISTAHGVVLQVLRSNISTKLYKTTVPVFTFWKQVLSHVLRYKNSTYTYSQPRVSINQ